MQKGDGNPEELNLIRVFLLCWFDFKRYSSSVSEIVITFVLLRDAPSKSGSILTWPRKEKELEKM